MSTFADRARPLIARGIPVFPCDAGKRPLTENGFKDASSDPDQIAAWSNQYPDALVAQPTGHSVFVLDVDVDENKGIDGFATLQANGWRVPTTRFHRTRRGGAHFWFLTPPGVTIRNSAGKLGKGLDIRGEGGYVIRWDRHEGEVRNPDILAEPPSWLLDTLQSDSRVRSPGMENYGLPDEQIAEGARNGTLTSLAGSMWAKGIGMRAIEAALLAENEDKCVPPLDKKEVQRIVRSVARYERGRLPVSALHSPSPASVVLVPATEIEVKPISWLWPDWIALGKVTLLAGAAGTGKTTLAMALGAAATCGGLWPDGSRCTAAQTVLIWSGEDDPGDTLIPRLMACGADTSRVRFVRAVKDERGETLPFDPARDIPELEAAIQKIGGASLLIVDPIVSAVAGDMHKASDVRRSLQALVNLAERQKCAVLGITHLSKGSAGSTPQDRVIGSQAFSALARTVLMAAKQEDAETRVLVRAKSNISIDNGGVAYTVEACTLDNGIQTTRVLWCGTVKGTAREILGAVEYQAESGASAMAQAEEFLRDVLADGPVPAKTVLKDGEEAGHSRATIRRAQRSLGVIARKQGRPGDNGQQWVWSLPEAAHRSRIVSCPEDEHLRQNVSPLDAPASLKDLL